VDEPFLEESLLFAERDLTRSRALEQIGHALHDLGVRVADGLPTWRADGCDECKKTGYKGRVAIVELLVAFSART
jgi:type II secretory ATPase GspE/PulE/Tfp pilus assembly ATPase PilB-like protein